MDLRESHRPFDVFHPNCPSRQAFETIFSRWGILTLARLTEEPVRFGSLYRSIGGISEKMLAQTLKVLEAEGLVDRQEYEEKPPRVEYRLTTAGRNIAASLEGVIGTLYDELENRFASPKP